MNRRLLLLVGLIVTVVIAFSGISAMAYTGYGFYYATPSWDQTLSSYWRFVVLTNMNSEAVLDKETGLVWEKSPSSDERYWVQAVSYCYTLKSGGRMGWRIPKVEELFSLVDPNQHTFPSLPIGHPFTNLQVAYWAASTHVYYPTKAMVVWFNGSANAGPADKTTDKFPIWCVRGGNGYDVY